MSSDRKNALDTLYKLLESNTFDDLVKSHDLIVNYHPTEPLVILRYNLIEKNKNSSDVDSCRGLIMETFYPYKIISHGFDRFSTKRENMSTVVNLKKATIKEDGSMMFLFKYKNNFHLATMYDFALNTMAFSDQTYSSLFLQIINQPLNEFANKIINQFPEPESTMTLSFEMCSVYNRVIKEYPTPTLFLTSVYGGLNGLTEFDINSNIELCPNVKVIHQFKFNNNIITIKDAYDQVNEYVKEHINNLTFEGIVLLTDNDKKIKIKNHYYDILHMLKYMGFLKCTPELMIPLIIDELDDIIIDVVVNSLPHDKNFIELELKKRRDNYLNIMNTEREKILNTVVFLKENNIDNPKDLIKIMNLHDKQLFDKWSGLFFKLVKFNFDDNIINSKNFFKECLANIKKVFNSNSHKLLSETHPNVCCNYNKNFDFNGRQIEPNDGIGLDAYTCFCGSSMKLTELRTSLHRYKYCHCGEAYDFLTYDSWTYLMLCSNSECTCTHETNIRTKLPLGVPASNFCKSLRLQIHELINNSNMTKNECYKKIQEITGKTESEAHMAKFSVSDCLLVLNNF